MDRDDFACRNCGDTDSPLHVHHANYEKGMEPWDYDDSQLVTFCAACHAALEARIKALRYDLATIQHKRLLVFFCKNEEEATEYENIVTQALSKKRKKK